MHRFAIMAVVMASTAVFAAEFGGKDVRCNVNARVVGRSAYGAPVVSAYSSNRYTLPSTGHGNYTHQDIQIMENTWLTLRVEILTQSMEIKTEVFRKEAGKKTFLAAASGDLFGPNSANAFQGTVHLFNTEILTLAAAAEQSFENFLTSPRFPVGTQWVALSAHCF